MLERVWRLEPDDDQSPRGADTISLTRGRIEEKALSECLRHASGVCVRKVFSDLSVSTVFGHKPNAVVASKQVKANCGMPGCKRGSNHDDRRLEQQGKD